MGLPIKSGAGNAGMHRAGDVFGGRCEVVRFLARGGFGSVYRVRDRHFRRRYLALKVLDTSNFDAGASMRAFLRKFNDEANVQVALRHAGIVPVFDYRPDLPEPFIVMELVEEGLDAVLERGRMDWPDAAPSSAFKWRRRSTTRIAMASRRPET